MWIKKSDIEINEFLLLEARKRKRLIRPLLWASAWTSLLMGLNYLGFRGGTRGFYAFSAHPGFSRGASVVGILIFVVAFGLVYYRQRRGLTFFDDVNNSLLCGSCYEPSSPNINSLCINSLCECGGRLEPYEYYRWEDDEIEADSNLVTG